MVYAWSGGQSGQSFDRWSCTGGGLICNGYDSGELPVDDYTVWYTGAASRYINSYFGGTDVAAESPGVTSRPARRRLQASCCRPSRRPSRASILVALRPVSRTAGSATGDGDRVRNRDAWCRASDEDRIEELAGVWERCGPTGVGEAVGVERSLGVHCGGGGSAVSRQGELADSVRCDRAIRDPVRVPPVGRSCRVQQNERLARAVATFVVHAGVQVAVPEGRV